MALNRAKGFRCKFRRVVSTTTAFFQVEASHFPLRKFQGASHNTEVEYITNDRPGEPLTRK